MDTMSKLADFVNSHRPFLEALPLPIYATHLDTGRFDFVNQAFADMLGYDCDRLLHERFSATSLYSQEANRHEWAQRMRGAGGRLVASFAELVRNPDRNSENARLFVVDAAIGPVHGITDDLVLGMVGDVSEDLFEREALANRLKAYQAILNLDWINVGIHEIDPQGFIVWMNSRERKLLGLDQGWFDKTHRHVTELSEREQDAKRERVRRKLLGIHPLTEGEHRTFLNHKTGASIPVNIHDFPVPEPDPFPHHGGRQRRRLVTAVRDEQTRIAPFLKSFLPQNPLLEELGVYTFVKVLRKFAHDATPSIPDEVRKQGQPDDLIFSFANGLFLEEIKALSARKLLGVEVKTHSDLIGRTEIELFPEFASAYQAADRSVLKRRADDQRIERHPSTVGDRPIDVWTLKLPLYKPSSNGAPDEKPIGVQGYFWDVSKTDILEQKLAELHNTPWEILNHIPVPVYRKDRNKRFTYVNGKYLEDVKRNAKKAAGVRSLSDIIGKRDIDLFEKGIAQKYEADDEQVMQGKKPYDEPEPHGDKFVRVIKNALVVPGADEAVGLQGVFWEPHPKEIPRIVWIDWLRGIVNVRGHEPIDVQARFSPPWCIFELLAQELGKPIAYGEISAVVLGHADLEKAKSEIHSHVHSLRESLKSALKSRGVPDLLSIPPYAEGYSLQLRVNNGQAAAGAEL